MNTYISKISIIFIIFNLKFQVVTSETDSSYVPSSSKNCYLTNRKSMDPFPSLEKCYKYNNEACCTSVHDEYISGYIESILPSACVRKYNDFENLMCFGCHPLSSNYIDVKNKTIRICKSFLRIFWNATNDQELLEPTTIFDNCGFKTDLDSLSEIANGIKYIIPSEIFQNLSQFFEYVNIPFFEDFKIVIQNETNWECYNSAQWVGTLLLPQKIKKFLIGEGILILLVGEIIDNLLSSLLL